jgi:protein TonB
MFEDSTFESAGKIKSKSGQYALITGPLCGGVLLVMILLPLIYPEALPKAMMTTLLVAPPPPPPPPPPPAPEVVHVQHVVSEMMNNQLVAPTKIPHDIKQVSEKEAPAQSFGAIGGLEGMSGSSNGVIGGLFGGTAPPKVKAEAPKKVNISGGVMQGNLVAKTPPIYPPIAKAARVSGTVVLQATISKTGTIENLRVISGPAMLQPAALDAVKSWRYRPYLLNGDPVEVETTVNVIFTLGG